MSNAYFLLKNLACSVRSLYFKDVHIVGKDNIPSDGPVIICGNHANQFIDPIMIASSVNRHISFTIAASSFKKPIVGQMAKAVKAIPVKRPEDSKIKGSGKLRFISGNQIKGINTNFREETLELTSGWSIMIKSLIISVKKIVDDDTLEISPFTEINDYLIGEYEYSVRIKRNIF